MMESNHPSRCIRPLRSYQYTNVPRVQHLASPTLKRERLLAPKCACFDRLVAYHSYHQTGEGGGNRTLDTVIKSHVLYRLSYTLTGGSFYRTLTVGRRGRIRTFHLTSPLRQGYSTCSPIEEFLQNSKLRTRDLPCE